MAKAKLDPTEGTPFEAVIGLEVHAQLKTRTKMFCGCENRYGAEPNTLTCPVCLGHPGSLPAINRRAVEYAVRVGLACGCEIARFTKFDRKNYYYPDLPKNYQISQYDMPLCGGGAIDVYVGEAKRRIGLTRIHLEEDAGKNIHAEGRPESWVDLNRAGVPLLEIVSKPDLGTPEEAGAYLRMLRQILLYLDVSDCNMEEGSLRCDVNVSIRPRGTSALETRTEIKNLNSFTFVENALAHEIRRQIKVRSSGGTVEQQTLLYDPARDETRVMRGKEEAHDYRYFPEPDLAPLSFTEEWVEGLRRSLPELPAARYERLQNALGLSAYHADVLVRDRGMADFFEECVALYPKPQAVANWVVNAVREEANIRQVSARETGVSPSRLVDLVRAIDEGKVSNQKARDVFKALLGNERPVADVIRALGLEQISDDAFLRDAVSAVIQEHPGPAEDVRKGKKNSVNFLVGQVMRRTKGQANPGMVAKLIGEVLGAS
ncbi:MAG: Asp-tRNA(Asn)/Glu-tRNA(Gln) amidotransferase subunit GatB [Planctomycetes bacterium]|nr:Asp-tRNA(Asn)/Glu-tRNA(Gln) amidotransferase subunit GatB [Planctomycetota bacterium]